MGHGNNKISLKHDGRLWCAIINESLEELNRLYKLGVNFNIRDEFENTPLLYALEYYNNPMVVKFLIEKFPEQIHLSNRLGKSPLMVAASWGLSDICQMLISLGAYIEERDYYQMTPLGFAARSCLQTTKLLVANGAEINEINRCIDCDVSLIFFHKFSFCFNIFPLYLTLSF